ncbi:hypothetical protein DICVIV_06896 [Dictyocaulus viviparus]|uniref:Protein kinase domain-containing protein n=1 Tax=Dictyocaulus viviparus TaxID=29172 RepID=A0A0D8XTF2_DICVI|nr:hypothetical protein DICVIV_06896 [Dictyocaulus viviparus]
MNSSTTMEISTHLFHLKYAWNLWKLKPVSPSTYQMAKDNIENALLEKCPIIAISSDYADPDFSYRDENSSLEPLLHSFHDHIREVNNYADSNMKIRSLSLSSSTKQRKRRTRYVNPLASVVKYSDYGEVYCSTLPEINRKQLDFIEKIGQGEFGELHRCLLESRQVAVKRLRSTSYEDEVAFLREIRVLGNLKHPNVVEVIGVSTIDKPMICIMEYMANGDLKSFMNKLEHVE